MDIQSSTDWIGGRNPVLEAIKSGRTIEKLLIADGMNKGSIGKILVSANERKIPVQSVPRTKLDQLVEGNHQGVIAHLSAHTYGTMEDVYKRAEESGEPPFLLILDGIEDPHNLGAIIRTAECAGVHGVMIPKRRAAGLTSTVAKTAAGALEYVPVVKVGNLAQQMEKLKEEGFWIYGTAFSDQNLFETELSGSIAIVVGNEGKGISKNIRDHCDALVSIPMVGNITSLNASVATAVVTYEVRRQRDLRGRRGIKGE
jgi:23S rRNA (guanosine2251-2'-O)-methyltransferase